MDSVAVLWAVVFVLSAIVIIAQCISCRRKIPVHIIETDYYDDKVQYISSPPSFMIIKRPSDLPRTLTSQATTFQQDFLLPFPRSPVLPDSRRSSVGRDLQGISNGCECTPITMVYQHDKTKENDSDDPYDDEGGDANYSNDNPGCGYIEVLPDPGPVVIVSCSPEDNRVSLSSLTIDDNYVNVLGSSDSKGGSQEYVNVEDEERPSSPSNHDMPDYENVDDD
ncbi:linker for activation of T-cells family member 1-like isoform X2 [Mixophyes fleayi]|uniref:linker for activation of T-cells family member 1-like isoform X2 n=1 Tax=Mixophyes fleayi TaxID=3061075 RepID=UPI003F4DF2DA